MKAGNIRIRIVNCYLFKLLQAHSLAKYEGTFGMCPLIFSRAKHDPR